MRGVKIRKLRDNLGYSQEYVAAKLGIAQNTYSKIETGQSPLTIERAKKLAELFEVEPDFFFSDQEIGVVNHNNGNDYKLIFNPETYIDNQKELLELIIKDKDDQIAYLKEELEKTRKQLKEFFDQLTKKI
jgi:transcriptional regulator with XRE-family HTH domain